VQPKQALNLNPIIIGLIAGALALALLAFAMPVIPTMAQTATATPAAASPTATTGVTNTIQGVKVLRIGEDIYPDVMDPQKSSFVNEIEALSLAYEGLLRVDADGKIAEGAADRFDLSDDGLTMTFHIQDGLKRADGTPLTAKDFEYALKRAVDPHVTGKQYVSLLFDVKGAQELAAMPPTASETDIEKAFANYGVKAVDDSTLQVTFNTPSAYWDYIATMPVTYPVDPKIVEKDPENWWRTPANHNGNGPFVFKTISVSADVTDTASISGTQQITFDGNPNYWQGKPNLDRIEITYNPDNEANLKAFEDGTIDIDASLVAELVPTVISNTNIVSDFLHYPSAQTVALAFNNTRKPFDDRNVRIAFSEALDRIGFINDQLGGVGKPYTRWIPPDVPGNQAFEPGVPDYDPKAAVNTLVNNGYAASDSTASSPKVDCAKLGEIKFTYPDSPINQKRADYVINNLSTAIGCKITADPVAGTEYTSLTKDVRTNPQLSFQRWVQDYPHPQNWLSVYWQCGAFSRRYGYCNLFLDQILKQADATEDPEKALALYEQAEDMLIQDVPGAFAYTPENLQLVKSYVVGPDNNLSSQDAGWAGMFGPVWEYDIDLTKVPSSYPKQ
jgi:oligopeptide transport system substrate-binding protein